MVALLVISAANVAQAQRGGFRGGVHASFGGGISRAYYGGGIRTVVRPYYNPYVGLNSSLWLGSLPYGYYPFYYGANPYFYYGGQFYQQAADKGYQVIEAPVGAEVPVIPDDSRPVMINGTAYLAYGNVYYVQLNKADGLVTYMVAGRDGRLNTKDLDIQGHLRPLIGDVVAKLPSGAKKMNVDGRKYWVTPSGLQLEKIKMGDERFYRVVLA